MGDLRRTWTQKTIKRTTWWICDLSGSKYTFSDAKVDISFQSFQSYHSTQLRSSFTALSSLQPRKDLTVNTSYGAAKPSQTCRTQRMRRPWEVKCIKLPSVSCKKVTHQVLLSHMWRPMCVEWCILKPAFAMCSHSKDQVCVTGSRGVSLSHLPEIRCPSIFKVWLWLSPWILISMQALKHLRSQRKVELGAI